MPDSVSPSLRLYCTCGQKMKVSESSYGLPGKCVSCRLKIRLPRLDEIPKDSDAIYLKDHPNLIRQRGPRTGEDAQKALDAVPGKPISDGDPTPVTELDIGDDGGDGGDNFAGSLPLDPMESLQKLTSLEQKLERQLASMDRSDASYKNSLAEFRGRLKRVRDARNGLNEHMHQLLMEVAIELTNTQEKISKVQISARVGEIAIDEFQDTVYRLRHRRDRLERRQVNLRGWIAATDPANVGGYIDVAVGDIPDDGFTLPIPSEPEDFSSLLNAHARSLQHAFEIRKNTEKKMNEIKRLGEASEGEKKAHYLEAYETTKGVRRVAKAQVQFYQQRLRLLIIDYEGDLETLESQREIARDKLSVNQINRVEFDKFEDQLRRIKTDIAKGIGLAKRLVHANSLDDVPQARGTFLQRLGFGLGDQSANRRISMALWAASILWVLSVFIPSMGSTSLLASFSDFNGTGSKVALILVLPLLAAISVAGISFLTNAVTRGITLLVLGGMSLTVLAYCVNEANFSLDLLAKRFRSGTTWILRPGMAAMILASTIVLFNGVTSLAQNKTLLRGGLAGITLITMLVAWIGMNGFGQYLPSPVIENLQDSFSEETGRQSGRLRISNEGSRTLHLVSRRTSARNGYLYTIERKMGGTSFSEITPEGEMIGTDTSYADISIAPGANQDIVYNLPADDYHLLLIAHSTDSRIEKTFSVVDPNARTTESPLTGLTPQEPVVIETIEVPAEISETVNEPEVLETVDDAESLPTLPTVELSGVVTGADGIPHFSLELFMANDVKGRIVQMSLDDPITNGWSISEYNPSLNTVTLKKENKYLVLRRGERIALDS